MKRLFRKNMSKLAVAVLTLSIALVSATAATFAWYIYNVNAHTTRVHMAAGSNVSLRISKVASEEGGTSTVLDEFRGTLNPVSTDNIQNGFQKVLGFTNGTELQSKLVANLFGQSIKTDQDYYMSNLYLKTTEGKMDVYLSDLSFDEKDIIATAMRVGFVVPSTGDEFIFELTGKHNDDKIYNVSSSEAASANTADGEEEKPPYVEYNTQQGAPGHVLNSEETDGSTVEFTSLNSSNFCNYNSKTGEYSLKENSKKLLVVTEEPTLVEVYIWLEGCDEDCTNSLVDKTLSSLSLSFCGMQ